MVAPLVAAAIGSFSVGAASNLYSQWKQRDLYRYQRAGYLRAYDDYVKYRLPKGRTVKYPELSYPGKIRALDTGISQSYAASLGSTARFAGSLTGSRIWGNAANAYSRGFRTSRSLYGGSVGRSSRWL